MPRLCRNTHKHSTTSKTVTFFAGYSLFIGIAVPSGKSLALDLAHGPINVAAGITGGVLAGLLLGCTRLWHTRLLRTIATLVLSQLLMFLAFHFHYTGGAYCCRAIEVFAVVPPACTVW